MIQPRRQPASDQAQIGELVARRDPLGDRAVREHQRLLVLELLLELRDLLQRSRDSLARTRRRLRVDGRDRREDHNSNAHARSLLRSGHQHRERATRTWTHPRSNVVYPPPRFLIRNNRSFEGPWSHGSFQFASTASSPARPHPKVPPVDRRSYRYYGARNDPPLRRRTNAISRDSLRSNIRRMRALRRRRRDTTNSASAIGNNPPYAPPAFRLHDGNPLLPPPAAPLPLPEPPPATVTVAVAVPVWPFASVAVATSVWVPGAVGAAHVNWYGAVSSVPTAAPSTVSATFAMPASSVAATTTATEPLTSSPSVGDTIDTNGVVVPLPFEPEPEPEPE